jgi:hypothetical protein
MEDQFVMMGVKSAHLKTIDLTKAVALATYSLD